MEGGVMRAGAAASKVAGMGGGVINGGLRGSAAVPPVEHSIRMSPMPASAILSSSSSSCSSSAKAIVSDVAPIQRPAWDVHGWEEDLVIVGGEPLPRVVFPGAPSFDEAKEATFELKDALDKVYLSTPESSESGQVVAANQFSGLSMHSNPGSNTKSHLVVETAGGSPVPNPALKAFKLLSQSTEVQTVVASLASDQNVWDAAMQNPVLQDFIKSNQQTAAFQEQVFAENVENSSEVTKTGDSENWFQSSLRNIKQTMGKIMLTVVELVSSLSGSLQNIFGFSPDVYGDKKATMMDNIIGASFIGLSTLVAMVVLLKRG